MLTQLAQAVRERRVSAVELVQESIARIERLDPALNAVTAVWPEEGLVGAGGPGRGGGGGPARRPAVARQGQHRRGRQGHELRLADDARTPTRRAERDHGGADGRGGGGRGRPGGKSPSSVPG